MRSTIVKDWVIVSVIDSFDSNRDYGKYLWGIIYFDEYMRFQPEDFVCTSRIVAERADENKVITINDNIYCLEGKGTHVTASVSDLYLLKEGYSPSELKCKISR